MQMVVFAILAYLLLLCSSGSVPFFELQSLEPLRFKLSGYRDIRARKPVCERRNLRTYPLQQTFLRSPVTGIRSAACRFVLSGAWRVYLSAGVPFFLKAV